MYLEYFGLTRPPFKITPDTSLFYEGGNRGAVLEALSYAILQGEGIIKVVGEVGSGKTMLCRMLEITLPDNVEIVYLGNPSLSPEKILHVIALELKLAVAGSDDKTRVMHAIHQYLLDRHAKGKQVVVFIEEAQGMPLETLEEIRLLSNLETGDSKLLQIVLFGQPELDENLAQKQIRQLRERISQHFSLDTFNKKDIQSYLNFRLRAAGYKGADLFNAHLAAIISRHSRGLSRRINILADKALLAAFSEGAKTVKSRHIRLAAQDSQFSGWPFAALGRYAGIAISIVSIFILGFVSSHYISVAANTSTPQTVETAHKNDQQYAASIENKREFSGENHRQQLLSDDNGLFEQRVRATNEWLLHNQNFLYSIQLMMVEGEPNQSVVRYLQKLRAQNMLEQIYIYPAIVNHRNVHNVVFGEFYSYEDAQRTIEQLPEIIKKDGPFIRSISTIRKESNS